MFSSFEIELQKKKKIFTSKKEMLSKLKENISVNIIGWSCAITPEKKEAITTTNCFIQSIVLLRKSIRRSTEKQKKFDMLK